MDDQRSSVPDTQWPRYQVFVQERPGEPFQDAGSVHAPDPEMALLNARDVFARRPECSAMWVARADRIYSRTREQLSDWEDDTEQEGGPQEEYYIFCKKKSAGTQTLLGKLEAPGPAEALKRAIEHYKVTPKPFLWWALPAGEVFKSSPEDSPSFFSPAHTKTFRLSTDFHTVSAMRELRGAGAGAFPAGKHRSRTKDGGGS